jgi:hypothetical protein
MDQGLGVKVEERVQRAEVAAGLLEERRARFPPLGGEGERVLTLQDTFDEVRLPGVLEQGFRSAREFSPQPGAEVGDGGRVRTLRREQPEQGQKILPGLRSQNAPKGGHPPRPQQQPVRFQLQRITSQKPIFFFGLSSG